MPTKSEQYQIILEILNNMQYCLDNNNTFTWHNSRPFNLNPSAGICWHVLAYIPNHVMMNIGTTFLQNIFEEMGLNSRYPVEMQIINDHYKAVDLYSWCNNKYDPSSEQGKLRRKLLKDLIQYFKKEIAEL